MDKRLNALIDGNLIGKLKDRKDKKGVSYKRQVEDALRLYFATMEKESL